jgi:hypothetical protein
MKTGMGLGQRRYLSSEYMMRCCSCCVGGGFCFCCCGFPAMPQQVLAAASSQNMGFECGVMRVPRAMSSHFIERCGLGCADVGGFLSRAPRSLHCEARALVSMRLVYPRRVRLRLGYQPDDSLGKGGSRPG